MKNILRLLWVVSIILTNNLALQTSIINIDILEEQQEAATEFVEAGIYPVTLYRINEMTGEREATTILMTVIKPNTVQAESEAIDAYDVLVETGTLDQLTAIELTQLTNAHAWDMQTGSQLPITLTQRVSYRQSSFGQKVTFQTAKGTAVTVKIIEMGQPILNIKENYVTPQYEAIASVIVRYTILISVCLVFFMLLLLVIIYLTLIAKIKKTHHLLYNLEESS